MKSILLVGSFIIGLLLSALGMKVGAHRPYVQGMEGPSVLYAKCIPDAAVGNSGKTTIYRVRAEADEVVDIYPWFSPRGVVIGWSPIAGKVAVMSFGEHKPDPDKRIEVAIHLGGKTLQSYTTSDLKTMGIDVGPSMEGGTEAHFKVSGCLQVPNTNEYDFVIESANGTRLAFDILTGKLRNK